MNTEVNNPLKQQQKILIAGSNREDVTTIESLLNRHGYSTHVVHNGKDAVEYWHSSPPDIAIIDAQLSLIDGLEVVNNIRSSSKQDKFVPVIMLVDSTDQMMFYEMIASGIDDIIDRPFNEGLILMKVKLLGDMQLQMNALRSNYDVLFSQYTKLQYEHDAAERLFLNITQSRELTLPNVKCHMSPQSLANGDIFLYEELSNSNQYFLLGDFTGHGLVAAIGACSIKDTFVELSRRNAELTEIVDAVNNKLVDSLPPERFFAACLLRLNRDEQLVDIWNGGIPVFHIYNNKTQCHEVIPSIQPPLGITKFNKKHLEVQRISLTEHDRILISSDGMIEAKDKLGGMFGLERVKACIAKGVKVGGVFEELYTELLNHRAGTTQTDDVTLIEISY